MKKRLVLGKRRGHPSPHAAHAPRSPAPHQGRAAERRPQGHRSVLGAVGHLVLPRRDHAIVAPTTSQVSHVETTRESHQLPSADRELALSVTGHYPETQGVGHSLDRMEHAGGTDQDDDPSDIRRALAIEGREILADYNTPNILFPFITGFGCTVVSNSRPPKNFVSRATAKEWLGRAERAGGATAQATANKVDATALSLSANISAGQVRAFGHAIIISFGRTTEVSPSPMAVNVEWYTENDTRITRSFGVLWGPDLLCEVLIVPDLPDAGMPSPQLLVLQNTWTMGTMTAPIDAFGTGAPAAPVSLDVLGKTRAIKVEAEATGLATGTTVTITSPGLDDIRMASFFGAFHEVLGV